jgi:hypothetical protein
MAEDKQSGLKSAFDLAMERMAAKGERMVELGEEQKKALADLSRRTKAKVAEVELMFAPKLAEARAANDAEKTTKLDEEQRGEIRKLKEREEADRARIRGN